MAEMTTTVTVTGLSELQQSLKELPGKLQEKLLVQAVSRAAALLQKEMKARVPIRKEPGAKKISKRGGTRLPGFLRKHIGRLRVDKSKNDAVTYQIGPRKAAYYGLMLELGTRHSAKRPFMRPAMDAQGRAAVDKMAETLRAGLDGVVQSVRH